MSEHPVARPAPVFVVVLSLLLSMVATLALTSPVGAQSEFIAEMSGAAEVPGPGDPDGAGFASVFVDPGAGEVCAFIEVTDIAQASAAHIHAGAAGVEGPIVVTLPTPGADGVADGCVTGLDSTMLQDIHDNPGIYYVNVHTGDFPAGAVRGQLTPAPVPLFAGMDGASEVPGPGDPDGSGFAAVAFFVDLSRVCAFIEALDIAAATAAHVHSGAAGVEGPVVITLPTPDANGVADGCVEGVDPILIQQILANPASYYVNVHTADFPAGAVRGQLSSEPPQPPVCAPGELCNGEIAPGTYTYTGFGTDLTFTTADPWFFFSDDIPSMNLFPLDQPAGLFGFPFVGQVFADPCDLGSVTTIGDSPAELMAWLGDRPFLDTTAPVAVNYGGAAGLEVDLASVTVPAECVEPPVAFVFSLPVVEAFFFENGSIGKLVALDVAGETILFIAEHVSSEGGDPVVFLARAQGVLDSFVWALAGPPAPPPPTPQPAAPTLPNTATSGRADPPAVLGWAVLALGLGTILCASALVRVFRRRLA